MNVHDSERLSGLLESAGYVPAAAGAEADVVVFNTCAVRENADNRLYGNLGQLVPAKKSHPGMQIAVGGCLAQKDRATILDRAPWVDVVFGTHNLHRLPVLLERARHNAAAQLEIVEALEVFPSTLPTRRASHHCAWVSISVGCDNTCTFCIVPSLRGTERDRRPGDVLAEVEALVAEGVLEITLLGQNVNSYGRSLGDPGAFAKLLRSCGGIEGLERVRFTSPHPRDFTDDVIEAMAATPNVCHQLHMPLQSGSDAVLRRMRRSYRRERYLGIIERVRAAMPDAAISTDIIVGFPGETEADFVDTLDVVRAARFSGAFTFQYSPRPGTPAATMDHQIDRATVAERYGRLVALQDEISWAENRELVGARVELLVAEGEGRKDDATGRLTGRARDGRLVHFRAAELTPGESRPGEVRPGDVVETLVTRAAPHHLTADGPLLSLRRTRAGDAWEQARRTSAATPDASSRPTVTLGMPALRPTDSGSEGSGAPITACSAADAGPGSR
ncbi:tRNA (N6-isopentenyl adenosine(37)-C2)-methylthiotransferase MiaB [Frankia sp. AiPa1]|uniref:tRNA (N6-isopentenyl adenosine(37)-C2)-methylthiotransferase MiaB n=1 Tax=Frankia sp. AiPa1 TaxID=573492 RepID=UPI00202B25E3|nr:tRNA (N6-isopentenyl adenosine(37)-C2)-methylthiotransferase MiaB [Frankia sp. AiPa1]